MNIINEEEADRQFVVECFEKALNILHDELHLKEGSLALNFMAGYLIFTLVTDHKLECIEKPCPLPLSVLLPLFEEKIGKKATPLEEGAFI